MAVIYQEDFNSIANGTLLNTVTGWTVSAQFTPTVESVIVNNGQVDATTSGTFIAYYDTQESSYYVEATFYANSSDQFETSLGPAVRVIDYDNAIYTTIYNNDLRIWSEIGGSTTTLASPDQIINSGDVIRLEVEGDTLRAYVNSVQVGADVDITGILSGSNAGVFCSDLLEPAFDNFEVGNFISDTITISGVEDREIINVVGATHDYTLSGTYTGATTPTAIQYRVEEFANNATVTDWTTLDASPSAGSYSGVITVPKGAYYRLMVRYSNDVSITASSSRIGFGMILEFAGQSNISRLFNTYTPATISDNVALHDGSNWALPSVGEFIEGLNKLAADNSCVVGCFNTAVSATAISAHLPGGSNYAARVAGLTAVGGKLSGMLWGQGESNLSTAKATYKTDLGTLYTDILTRTGQPSSELPMFIVQLGRNATQSGNDSGWSNIREAQAEFASETAGAYISHQTMDLPMADTLHRDSDGSVMEMLRFADTYDFVINSNAPSGLGATFVSASKIGNDITLSFDLNTATTLVLGVNSQNIFELSGDDFSTSVSPASVSISGNSSLVLTFDSIPSGTLKIRSCYGQDFAVSEFVTSNLQYDSQNVMIQPILNGATVSVIQSTLNMALTGTPDGAQNVRVIDVGNESLLYFGTANFTSGAASLSLPVAASTSTEYYAIGASDGALQRGVTQ